MWNSDFTGKCPIMRERRSVRLPPTAGFAMGLSGPPAGIAAFRERDALRLPQGFNPPPAGWGTACSDTQNGLAGAQILWPP